MDFLERKHLKGGRWAEENLEVCVCVKMHTGNCALVVSPNLFQWSMGSVLPTVFYPSHCHKWVDHMGSLEVFQDLGKRGPYVWKIWQEAPSFPISTLSFLTSVICFNGKVSNAVYLYSVGPFGYKCN